MNAIVPLGKFNFNFIISIAAYLFTIVRTDNPASFGCYVLSSSRDREIGERDEVSFERIVHDNAKEAANVYVVL